MEKAGVGTDSRKRLFGRLILKSLSLGALAGVVALVAWNLLAAAGAFAGILAGGIYAAGYVRSHVFRSDSERAFDPKVARHMMIRLVLVSVAGFGLYAFLGEGAVKAYLIAFLVGFPVLLISEAPRATRQLRARGLIG